MPVLFPGLRRPLLSSHFPDLSRIYYVGLKCKGSGEIHAVAKQLRSKVGHCQVLRGLLWLQIHMHLPSSTLIQPYPKHRVATVSSSH